MSPLQFARWLLTSAADLNFVQFGRPGYHIFDEIAIRSERSQESQYLQNILQTDGKDR